MGREPNLFGYMLAGMIALAAALWWWTGGPDPIERQGRALGALPVRMLDGTPPLGVGEPAVVHVWLPG